MTTRFGPECQPLGVRVSRECHRAVAIDVAGKLIEQDHQGQPTASRIGPVLELAGTRAFPELAKALEYLAVGRFTVLEPAALLPRLEPEAEHGIGRIGLS